MIAALYSSRSTSHDSPNKFALDGENFGWESIEDLLVREVKRISQNHLPRVPGLKESHIFRNPWTRLNVKPAKIMQVQKIEVVINFKLIGYLCFIARTRTGRVTGVRNSSSSTI